MASLGAQTVKNLPAMQETQVQSLRWENPLEKGMVTHSSILAWKIPWTQEPGGLQSIDSQRVRHDSVTNPFHFTFFSIFVAVVQSQSYVWLFVTAWTAACQTSLSFTISWSAQTHVHWVGVAVQPSHLLSPSPPAFSLSQHQGLFQWVSSLPQVAKILELQHQSVQLFEYSGLVSFRID